LKSEVEILEKGGVLKFCNSGFIFSMNWGKNQSLNRLFFNSFRRFFNF
jgi:hypothetical protein